MARDTKVITVTKGSDNIFADLGFEYPEIELAKADLVINITRLMRSKNLTQTALAKLMGIDQPQVSKLLRGSTGGYTLDRLTRILNQLGQDVEIVVKPKPANAKREKGILVVAESSGEYKAKGKSSGKGSVKKSSVKTGGTAKT